MTVSRRTIEKLAKVVRCGTGLGVRIPRVAVSHLRLKEGNLVSVRAERGLITIRRAHARKRWTERELLRGVTPAICGPDLIPDRAGRERV
jgi:antitoxin component of MazEF toxin-antitoxin module